ncbi:hypothetical protein niasHT_017247 [Heterodera trifolii]|uniref:Transmembrane protein 107 n=1 Tax=Heterodera trifolii TaxID=157864 RepID=A0ABD2LGN1_9BILA
MLLVEANDSSPSAASSAVSGVLISSFLLYEEDNPAAEHSHQLGTETVHYSLATFCGHALIACLLICIYIASNALNVQMVLALYTHYPWVLDTGSVVLSSWLLLWAGDSFRGQLLRDYRIPQIRFEIRANNRVASVKRPIEQTNGIRSHKKLRKMPTVA